MPIRWPRSSLRVERYNRDGGTCARRLGMSRDGDGNMDAVVELLKGGVALVGLLLLLVAIPTLFMFIFSIATGIDERLTK